MEAMLFVGAFSDGDQEITGLVSARSFHAKYESLVAVVPFIERTH
jgi:hypothetical protein